MEHTSLKILVVDDNRSTADVLARILRKQGDQVDVTYDGASAIQLIESSPPDVVFTDLKMEPVDGMEVLRAARQQRPPIEVIVFTAFGAVNVAVQAMRLGARDFLTKPVTIDQVTARLDQLRGPLGHETPAVQEDNSVPFIAEAPQSKALVETLRKAANVPSPVWMEGEIGSGRGHAALALHRMEDARRPFIIYDIGHEAPWPESATILLPNVDDLPDDLQRRLYRHIQHVPPGVRLIATAAPDGRRLVTEGKLRRELYYSLSVVLVSVPPLRERQEDVRPLIEQALQTFAARYNRPCPVLDDRRVTALSRHAWPGNVRELLNLAERAVVMGVDAFDLEVLEATPPGLPALEPGFSLSAYMESVERRLLVEALRKANGDRSQAGRLLGVERNTLRYKLNKYGLLDR